MLKEKKARFCAGCQAELSVNTLICAICATTSTGERSDAGQEATLRLLCKFAPVERKFVDRGGRSLEGHFRDECKHKARRAVKMDKGFFIKAPDPSNPGEFLYTKCIVMRWDGDERFRNQMKDLNQTREDMIDVDNIAESPGQEPPRKGDGEGRTRQAREETEGHYERVTVSGSKPETPMTEQPKYVHDRNAVRKGDVALRRGEKPPPGIGSRFRPKGPE